VLVVSPLYFAGSIELGVITQSSGAFNSILDDLSLIVNEFEGLSRFSASLGRLSTFVERMESYQAGGATNATFVLSDAQLARLTTAAAVDDANGDLQTTPGSIRNRELAIMPAGLALAVDRLTVVTPDGTRTLFSDVSVQIRQGQHLLVTGNSGTGKSSLLRAIAGLWSRGSGDVTRPLTADTMFLPQRPYCTIGSLRQQLIYPRSLEDWSSGSLGDDALDASLVDALGTVQLAMLAADGAAGLDEVRDWGDELSLGEQQRLAFARVLIAKPRLVVLDEATSALDLANEAIMYEALARVEGITYLSVGHRPSLLTFHKSRLRLYGADETPSYAVESIGGSV
jgi:putative ATP-binding cassette transporter